MKLEHRFHVVKLGNWLLCQAHKIVNVKVAFVVKREADEGIDELDKRFHELASLRIASNNSHLCLSEVCLLDLFHVVLYVLTLLLQIIIIVGV